ncbi:MAG: Crp/Fnr family transcriptional regulator [Zoogloeaceae bacterium]|jgi:CRP-like cAMP-binding protein|nr:Crp/Fnr family transcriptional regulator [Zoogloeaceae bacterium]
MIFVKLPEVSAVVSRLAAHRVFAGVEADLLSRLLARGCVKSCVGGQFLGWENKAAEFWWLVLEGEVELLRCGLDGEERFFGRLGAGELVAPALVFAPGGRYPLSFRTVRPALVAQMRGEDLRALCASAPVVAVRLLEMASGALCRRIEEMEAVTTGSAAQRLARYLLKLCPAEKGAKPFVLELPTSQRQLAASLGLRAETLSRLFAGWQRKGYLSGSSRRWRVLQAEALREL